MYYLYMNYVTIKVILGGNDMKDIFSYNVNMDYNAYMNWRTNQHDHLHNMHVVASGFANASLALVKQIVETGNIQKEADELIFPILFNANHAIEVYLKTINWSLNLILDSKESYLNTHDLQKLLNSVKEKSIEVEKSFDFEHHYGDLKKYIGELYKKIEIETNKGQTFSDITFARYALTRDKEPQFYINQFDNVVIDLPNFYKVFSKVFDNLKNLTYYYQETLQYKYDAHAEFYYE